MSPSFEKFVKRISEGIYKQFGKNSGTMLLATSILGTTASALAQAGVIFFNKKYTTSQKAFMIPQEIIECGLSAASLFFITKPVQKATLKTLQSGKILSKDLVTYLEKNNLLSKRGHSDFNLENDIKNIINYVKKSDKFIKASAEEQIRFLIEHKKALNDYNSIVDSTMAFSTTAAAAFSTAVVIPVVRNKFASFYQKKNLQVHDQYAEKKKLYTSNGNVYSKKHSLTI